VTQLFRLKAKSEYVVKFKIFSIQATKKACFRTELNFCSVDSYLQYRKARSNFVKLLVYLTFMFKLFVREREREREREMCDMCQK
jgi:hypothetical protein